MAVIDVLTVVDAVRLMRDFPNNDFERTGRYQQLPNEGENYLYMLVTWYDAWNEGESELDVFAKAGDTIRWRMTTTSAGINYNALIQELPVQSGSQYISTPQMKYEVVKAPRLDTTVPPPGRPIIQKVEDAYWEVNVRQPGPVTYHLNFVTCLLGGGGGGDGDGDGDNCNCCHKHGWTYDPFINRSKNSLRG